MVFIGVRLGLVGGDGGGPLGGAGFKGGDVVGEVLAAGVVHFRLDIGGETWFVRLILADLVIFFLGAI